MSAPPPPLPKPGKVKVFRALYDYNARSAQEMSFSEGDLIYVSEKGPNEDWLNASIGGRKGLVPANYVAENVEELLNPIHEAAKRGNVEFLKECLREQVSVNSLDKSSSTALYWASHGGHTEIVKILLAVPNVSVSSQNKLGDTPLHAASYKGHVDCVRLLLDSGAKPFVKNVDRKLPIDVAKDADVAALLSQSMKKDRINDDEYDAYQSDSDAD